MRRGLLWLLGATVLASGAALVVERPTVALVQALDSGRGASDFRAPAGVEGAQLAKQPLPSALQRWDIEPARRDPFIDAPANVTPPPRPTPPPPAQAAPPPPAPTPPPMAWRYLGAFEAPDGKRLVMLARQNDPQAVVVERGTRLSDGYEVIDISEGAIRLVYPPLQYEALITIATLPAPDR
jgi:hypothetical protein